MKSSKELYYEAIKRADNALNGKGNPNHDPSSGRFSSGGGSGSGGGKSGGKSSKKGKKVQLSTDERIMVEDALDQYASPDVTSKERDNINDVLEGKAKLTSSSRDIIDSALEEAYQSAQEYEDFENMTTLTHIQRKLKSLWNQANKWRFVTARSARFFWN